MMSEQAEWPSARKLSLIRTDTINSPTGSRILSSWPRRLLLRPKLTRSSPPSTSSRVPSSSRLAKQLALEASARRVTASTSRRVAHIVIDSYAPRARTRRCGRRRAGGDGGHGGDSEKDAKGGETTRHRLAPGVG